MAYCINATELQYCGYKYNYEYKYFTHKYQYKYKYFTHKYQYKYKYFTHKYQYKYKYLTHKYQYKYKYLTHKYQYKYKYFTHKYQYKYKYFTHKYQYKYKYFTHKYQYKYKYQKFVLKMYSSTSTSTKYHIYGKDATEIATDWNFQVSQCSEEKRLRWDAKSYDIYAQNFVGNLRNNLEKWSIFAKAVIRKLSVLLR